LKGSLDLTGTLMLEGMVFANEKKVLVILKPPVLPAHSADGGPLIQPPALPAAAVKDVWVTASRNTNVTIGAKAVVVVGGICEQGQALPRAGVVLPNQGTIKIDGVSVVVEQDKAQIATGTAVTLTHSGQ
jgi:hypothetical protein